MNACAAVGMCVSPVSQRELPWKRIVGDGVDHGSRDFASHRNVRVGDFVNRSGRRSSFVECWMAVRVVDENDF